MSRRKTTEEFVCQSKQVHGNRYDYSLVDYINNKTKVKIICPIHDVFEQQACKHIFGSGCAKCVGKNKDNKDVINDFKKVHGDKYDYSLVDYKNNVIKVKIICKIHGKFNQSPANHLCGKGCTKCGRIKNGIGKSNFHKKQRNWDFEQPESYKFIPLNCGTLTKVDNDDFEKLKDINWQYSLGYVKNDKIGMIHRFITNCPDDMVVDHINHDTLDNRKYNLRICTKQQNNMNKTIKEKTSKYKGVFWDKERCKWNAQIKSKNKTIYLGRFDDEIEAAKAYDKKAIDIFGEFSYTNFNNPRIKQQDFEVRHK